MQSKDLDEIKAALCEQAFLGCSRGGPKILTKLCRKLVLRSKCELKILSGG